MLIDLWIEWIEATVAKIIGMLLWWQVLSRGLCVVVEGRVLGVVWLHGILWSDVLKKNTRTLGYQVETDRTQPLPFWDSLTVPVSTQQNSCRFDPRNLVAISSRASRKDLDSNTDVARISFPVVFSFEPKHCPPLAASHQTFQRATEHK